jgi:hypothetical protein
MKPQSKDMLCLLFVCLSLVSVRAQVPISVCRAALNDLPERINGNLMRTQNNALVFIDDEERRERIMLDRSQLAGKRVQGNTILLYTNRPFTYNGMPRRHLEFPVTPGTPGCEAIKKWIEAGMTVERAPQQEPQLGPGITPLSPLPRRPVSNRRAQFSAYPARKRERYQVMHERWSGRDYGWLTIADTFIDFSCSSDSGQSRRWSLRDIKNIQQDGSFFLRIEPQSGRKYDFVLVDRGISRAKFADLLYHVRGNGGMSR